MATLLIGYQLTEPGLHHAGLPEHIRHLGRWHHPLDSVWLVVTAFNSEQVTNALVRYLDADDTMLVVDVSGRQNWTCAGFSQDSIDWLQRNV